MAALLSLPLAERADMTHHFWLVCRWVLKREGWVWISLSLHHEGNGFVGTQRRHAMVTEVVSCKTEAAGSRYEGLPNRHIDSNSNVQ